MDQDNSSADSDTVRICLPWTWKPVKRRMLPGCDLFREGDAAMQVARKLIPLEDEADDHTRQSQSNTNRVLKETIPCSVFGCNQTFTSLLSYENHYKSAHHHTCLTCHRTFPSAFLLDLHIQENHDPLFAVQATRLHMYRCLVESCCVKFAGPDDRRQHMIKVHCFPANFRFHRLRPAAHPRQRKKPVHGDAAAGDMDMDNLPSPREPSQADAHGSSTTVPTGSCASPADSPSDKENSAMVPEATLGGRGEVGVGMEVTETEKQVPRRVFVHRVPQNIAFGHGVSRGFQRPPGKKKLKKKGAHWHQRMDDSAGETTTNIEHVDMTDMAEALNEAS